ncbi:MAG: circularly permuted type 2 ATP-grasp protein [Gammaproteobacteria bacterium]|nr:circularly permuted type 2 ATP-grasp protein [Gammaproteobacteria bacterium]
MAFDWAGYDAGEFYDEMMSSPGYARGVARKLLKTFRTLDEAELNQRVEAANAAIKTMGITFTVYSDGRNIDRAWPFDIIPRVIPASEWEQVERGLAQRLTALNRFINDVYNEQKIFDDGIVPRDLIVGSANFREQCMGMQPAHGAWAHVCGSDLIRDQDGVFYVLEDNLRVPSGVSYMLENRQVTKTVLPELFEECSIRSVSQYTSQLSDTLASLSPRKVANPEIVVMTPGIYNSAYFEHAYLAKEMGAELVEGNDMVVGDDDCVYMKTINGMDRVDVIYRRIDDLFLDPEVFNPESALGVPGLLRAWRSGKVALANAPGAGVADDKAVYAYVPDIIRYYLEEEPLLNNVPTYLCEDKAQRKYVLANLDKLVVKPTNESGGYGLLVGPMASKAERNRCARQVRKDPRNYVAQPLVALSTAPTICGREIAPRHLDLRPFILQGEKTYVTAGGLTRVALQQGSFVVNSSQGGGSKDTWIVE